MNEKWNWLIGRRFSRGRVIDVFEGTVTVESGALQHVMTISTLLRQDYQSQDRAEQSMSEALNTGEGVYRP